MKKRKLTATLLAITLLISTLGINAFAADPNAAPKIKVFGYSVAKECGETVNLNIRLSDFEIVAGLDITLEGIGVTLEAPSSNEISLNANSNFTLADNKLHIVDLNVKKDDKNVKNGTINIKVPVKATSETNSVKVTAKLAANGTDLLKSSEYLIDSVNGKVAVTPKNEKTSENLKDNDSTFYPYGSVYTGDVCNDETRLTKDGNGSFTINNPTTYKAFTKPSNGILTFGTSKNNVQNAEKNLQFGTYTDKTNAKNGTMLIVGSWENYIDYHIRTRGLTVEEALDEMFNAKLENGKTYAKLYYQNSSDQKKAVLVYKKDRSTFTWKMTDNSSMEYALRVYDSGKFTCTAVGYYLDSNKAVFSNQLKSNNLK